MSPTVKKIKKHLQTIGPFSLVTFGLVACWSQPTINNPQAQKILGELKIDLNGMSYSPRTQDVPREGRFRLIGHNNNSRGPHDITFDIGVKLTVGPSKSAETELYISSNGLANYCSMPGHEQAGMLGMITFNGQTPSSLRAHMHKPANN